MGKDDVGDDDDDDDDSNDADACPGSILDRDAELRVYTDVPARKRLNQDLRKGAGVHISTNLCTYMRREQANVHS